MNSEKPVYMNKAQLVRQVACAPQTLEARLAAGLVSADAFDLAGHPLFRRESLEQIKNAIFARVEVLAV